MKTILVELSDRFKIVYTKTASEVSHVGLMIGVGSKDDPEDCSGMSHFIEHMWFKGTANRTSLQIINEIETLGGDFNAFTSKEETCVHISILKGSFDVALEVLSDIYFNSLFPEDELMKEREVILDEIDSYEDSPSELIFDEFEELLFERSNLSMPILGVKKTLENISSSNMKVFYNNKFLSANTVLSFVGNIPHDRFISMVKMVFPEFLKTEILTDVPTFDHICVPPFNTMMLKKTNQSHCVLGCKAYSFNNKHRFTLSMLNNILGGPHFSSILNYSLREKYGLTYNIESVYTPYLHTGSFLVYFGTDRKKVQACYDIIEAEFNAICAPNFFQEKIETYKKQLLGQLALSYDNCLNIMITQAKSVLVYNKVDSFKEVSKKFQKIDSSQLTNVANTVLKFEKMSFLQYS